MSNLELMGKRKEKDGEKEDFSGTEHVGRVTLRLPRRVAEDVQKILRTLVVVGVRKAKTQSSARRCPC